MKDNHISGYKLSKDTKIPQSLISNYKNGIKEPQGENLYIIADYFNVSVDYLLGKRDNKNAPTEEPLELNNVYLSFAKSAQDEGIDPEDIKMAIEMFKKMKEKHERDK